MLLRIIITLVVLTALLIIAIIWFRSPLADRFWAEDAAVLPEIVVQGSTITITDLRDWSYKDGEVTTRSFVNEEYDLENLTKTYYALQYLDRFKLTAHTFLVFEFNDGKELALSIEARKEFGEEYSSIKGIFNTFELIYVWGTGEDITSRRTDLYQKEIEQYELKISTSEQRAILTSLLHETQRLNKEPQFYNTLFKNCTNLLAKQVNELKPNAIPYHYSFILTGHSVEYLKRLGYITTGSI